jgi:hypothetical protein
MDWSLLQPQANKRFLRDVRGYKSTWWYYCAMIIDPILRFNWIFYAIYTHDVQHKSVVSFFVSLSECTRRGIWTIFRVENEHCTNVGRFRASRDVPLPYDIETSEPASPTRVPTAETVASEGQTTALPPSLGRRCGTIEDGQQQFSPALRQRATGFNITNVLANAHWKDFEKKRKPGAGDSDNIDNIRKDDGASDDRGSSDDDDDDTDERDERDVSDVTEAESMLRGNER